MDKPLYLNISSKVFAIFPNKKLTALDYILFLGYLVLFSWLITKVRFVKNTGISNHVIVGLFLLKIIAGITIGWVSLHVYGKGNDYWNVNRDGWIEYKLLWANPKEYFTNIFHSQYSKGYGGLFDSFQSFWNDLRYNIIIKFLSVCNFFSRGNYYINSIFFNFFVFLGNVAFYKLFIQLYKKQQWAVIICCFLLPSMLYFTSGIQKDGIVFTTLGFLCYAVFQLLQQRSKPLKKYLLVTVVALIILFLIRSYVLINLVPALAIWVLVVKFNWWPLITFVIGYIIIGVFFFNINSIAKFVDPPNTVVQKQADFFQLPIATTQLKTDTLAPNFKSFVSNAPQALNHTLLRPYINELPSKSLLPINIEILVYQLLLIVAIAFKRKHDVDDINPFIIFGLFFTVTMFLFIGYIMPNLGALIRYRSVYLVFIITPIVCNINWQKLGNLFKIKK